MSHFDRSPVPAISVLKSVYQNNHNQNRLILTIWKVQETATKAAIRSNAHQLRNLPTFTFDFG